MEKRILSEAFLEETTSETAIGPVAMSEVQIDLSHTEEVVPASNNPGTSSDPEPSTGRYFTATGIELTENL